MTVSDYDQRFGAIQRLYGDRAYALLPQLHFCVVGIGGVGSWAVEALARSGVGRITLIDYDEVALSNINRQLQARSDTVGQKKIEVMAERIGQINPHCDCRPIDDFITADNLATHLDKAHGYGYDYVIDAIDSIKFKAAMIYYCRRNKIPIITTGGAGGLTDPTLIQIKDLSRTYNDALAAKVRSALRDRHNFPRNPQRYFGVECVFSTQQPVYPKADGTVSHEKPGIHGVHLDCRFGYGSITFVTAAFGMTAAGRALDKALKKRLRQG
ncbi:MAG: tRNA cyclic N6-threonylcarbamoyladenosine(37) synthase TcdA [Gammaproteobacteria bacterium]|nr:tRNA cyclic N6-threonylcarbamoyladenosine(37) synthase TcdA [Gammaproteobacteria bacterium]